MRSFLAITRKDLRGYFDQPAGYLILVIFVGVLAYSFFRTALDTSEASLRPLFAVLPWLLAVFVPAATMRSFAEEERDGTLEILFTHPIRGSNVLLAKFAAGVAFVGAGILATVAIPLLLATAADLDTGTLVAEYIGSLLLASALVAIGLFTSSLARNQIVAFLLGLALNALLILFGLQAVLVTLPPALAGLLQGLSPLTHFSDVTRGVLALRDVLYFIAIVFTFLAGTYFIVRSKSLSHRSPIYHNLRLGVASLVVVSLLVGWFGSSIRGGWDLTGNRQHSVSPATLELVDGLDDILTIKLFATSDLPVQVSLVYRDIGDFLDGLAARSDNVRVIRNFPDTDEAATLWAQRTGITPVEYNVVGEDELQIKRVYLGLALTYADRQEVIPFLDSVEALEYRVASLVSKMVQTDRKTIGFLAGYGERPRAEAFQFLTANLLQQYDVVDLEPTEDAPLDLTGVDALVVAGPTVEVRDDVARTIDTYLANGGSALLLIDSVVVGGVQDRLLTQRNGASFSSFLATYGVTVGEDLVSDARVNEAIVLSSSPFAVPVPYPYWPRVSTLESTVTGGVESVILPWASTLTVTAEGESGREVLPILESSPSAVLEPIAQDVTPGQEFRVPDSGARRYLLGVAIAGESESGTPYRLVAVGDSDWLTDFIVSQSTENLVMGLNVIDWLAQEDALASIRSKVAATARILFTSGAHRNLVQYGSTVGIPLLFVAVGALRFVRRRSTTRKVYRREA